MLSKLFVISSSLKWATCNCSLGIYLLLLSPLKFWLTFVDVVYLTKEFKLTPANQHQDKYLRLLLGDHPRSLEQKPALNQHPTESSTKEELDQNSDALTQNLFHQKLLTINN